VVEGGTERRSVGLGQWHRLFFPLSATAWRALRSIGKHRDAAGWVRPANRDLLRLAAGIGSRNTWAKVASKGGELEVAGVLVVDLAPQSEGRPTHYLLTPVGLALVSTAEPGVSQVEPGSEPGGAPVFSSGSKSSAFQEKEGTSPTNGPSEPPVLSQPVSRPPGSPSRDVLELGPETLAALRDIALVQSGRSFCACRLPMVERSGKRGRFLGCVMGKPPRGCGANAPLQPGMKNEEQRRGESPERACQSRMTLAAVRASKGLPPTRNEGRTA
jgi:hypothetical protein